MEGYSSNHRLCSGPLSSSAQRVLAALRAQSRLSARNYNNTTSKGHDGRWRKSLEESQGGWSGAVEERTEGPWSRPPSSSPGSAWAPSSQRERFSWSSPPQAFSSSQREGPLTQPFSQESGPSVSKDGCTMALHTPTQETHWREFPDEIEPTFTLQFPMEDEEDPARPAFPGTEFLEPQRESPVRPCEPGPSRASVSLASESHKPDPGLQRGGRHALMEAGDGPWREPQPWFECTVDQENQREHTSGSEPRDKASVGEEDSGNGGSSGGVAKLHNFGSLLLPHMGHLTRMEAGCDRHGRGPMRGQEGEFGAGSRVGVERGMGGERGARIESGRKVYNRMQQSGDAWPEIQEDRAIVLDNTVTGSAHWIGQDLTRQPNEEAGQERERFPESDLGKVTDQSQIFKLGQTPNEVFWSSTNNSLNNNYNTSLTEDTVTHKHSLNSERPHAVVTKRGHQVAHQPEGGRLSEPGEMESHQHTERHLVQRDLLFGDTTIASLTGPTEKRTGREEFEMEGTGDLKEGRILEMEGGEAIEGAGRREESQTEGRKECQGRKEETRVREQRRDNTSVTPAAERNTGDTVAPAARAPSTRPPQEGGGALGAHSPLTPPPARTTHENPQHPTLTPTLKRKHHDPSSKPCGPPPKISLPRRAPVRWEPPGRSQTRVGEGVEGQDGGGVPTSTPKHPDLAPASPRGSQSKTKTPCNTGGPKRVQTSPPNPIRRPPAMQRGSEVRQVMERECGSTQKGTDSTRSSKTPKTSKLKPAKPKPENTSGDPRAQSKVCLTTALTCDPRVKDAGKLGPEERGRVLEEARRARALVLTMVFQDGSTQLDPEQKSSPPVCGLLVLMRADLEQRGPEECGGPQDSMLYLRLEHTPVWAQQHQDHTLDLFTRELLLQVVSGAQLVVCYKTKDFLRTVLQHYRAHLSWKQVWGCRVQDPQVCAWLLDPADPASCYQDLLSRHCRVRAHTHSAPALGTRKVSLVISSLNLLYKLNTELCSKLKAQGLWKLYTNMEISMIPVLAAMESHRIHVDKEALKRTSEMLGTKLKQLEQEAHKAAGQMFLVSSCTQLRTVLFDKLRLHDRCDNKKLPKTLLTQQQSTSEAALLQLQDLHPLPKIILEYRQIHKVKSTFVDGILSCMVSKNLISSTWHQTSAVTGRITAKNPNFQALPRQPIQITKKQYIQGKEAEVVAVHPRAMFIPQDGWTFLAADFCQVELRLLAHLSSDPELLRIFSDAQADVFSMLASQWKGVGEKNVSSEEREQAKRIVYSVVYGAGRERLSGILGVSAEQASLFQDSFLQTYKEVQAFIQRTIQQCHKQGYVVSIMGRRRSLPLIHSSDWGVRMQAERQAVNFVVQGSAADLCKMAMIRIFSQISSSSSPSARLLAQIHDELLYEVQDSQVEEVAALVKTTMESLQHVECLGVHLKVPLKVLLSRGKSWGSMSELNLPPTSPSPSL